MPTYIATFEESTSSSRSKVFTIPNIHSVKSISVNTGNVTHSISGNELTLNVSNGAYTRYSSSSYTPSQTVSDYRTSSSNSFASSISYNSGGYSGTLYTNGSSYVESGSYVPDDSRTQTNTMSQSSQGVTWTYSTSSGWTTSETTTFSAPTDSMYYTAGGYYGRLYYTNSSGAYGAPRPSSPATNGAKQTTFGGRTNNYSGTVTKPGSDTRIWRQNYSGTVYGSTQSYTTYYYAYTVTVKYADFPTVSLKVNSSDVTNGGSFSAPTKNNVTIALKGNDQDEGTTLQYSVLLRNIEKVPYTVVTKNQEAIYSVSYSDLLVGGNLLTVKVKDQYGAVTNFNLTIRNKFPQTLSLSSVLEAEQALGYVNSKKSSYNDIKPSGYNGKLSFSEIISYLS